MLMQAILVKCNDQQQQKTGGGGCEGEGLMEGRKG